MTYAIQLYDGKYTVINEDGRLAFLRHGESWPAADDLRHSGVVRAMAQRIEELEVAIRAVLNGTLIYGQCRNDDGMCSFDEDSTVPFRDWERRLRKVLEQTP